MSNYRSGYANQDRDNRFQDMALRTHDLQQGTAAGGQHEYTSNLNMSNVILEFERMPPPPYKL
jgi:hypothetical protein